MQFGISVLGLGIDDPVNGVSPHPMGTFISFIVSSGPDVKKSKTNFSYIKMNENEKYLYTLCPSAHNIRVSFDLSEQRNMFRSPRIERIAPFLA
jgi:hypothetical protein